MFSNINHIISSSEYTRPVDKKKLRFIINAIVNFSKMTGIEIIDLSILEAGCGRGGVTIPLAALGCRVTAFDVDKESVEYVEEQLRNRSLPNAVTHTASALSFNDGKKYDVIVASELFEHVLNPFLLAQNLKRRMSDNGILIVTTPNGYGPWEFKNRLKTREIKKNNFLRNLFNRSNYIYSGNTHEHCQFFRINQLKRMFNRLSLNMINFGKSDSVFTMLPNFIYSKYDWIARADMVLADLLPYWLASGWYFVLQMKQNLSLEEKQD